MEIKIESGTLQVSQKSGKTYTNCKLSDGSWLNIWGDQKENFGKTVNVMEPQQFGKSKWANIDKTKPEPKPESEKKSGITKQEYLNWMEEVWARAMKLEPDKKDEMGNGDCCANARAALINTAMIALTNGKIIIEDEEPPDELGDDVPF